MCVCVQFLSHVQFFWDPRDCSLPGLFVHGISQVRILERVFTSSSRRIFPTQGSNPHLLRWQADPLPLRLPNSIIAIPIWKRKFWNRHTQSEGDVKMYRETMKWRWRQRLQWYIYQWRNLDSCSQPSQSRKYPSLELSETVCPCLYSHFKWPASRNGGKEIPLFLSYPVCSSLLQQP